MDTGAMSPLLIGAALLMLGIYSLVQERKNKKRCSLKVQAVCTEIVEKTDVLKKPGAMRTVKQYVPVYEVQVDGKTIQLKGHTGRSYQDDYTKGKRIVLYCNPDNLRDFHVPDEEYYKTGRIALLITTGTGCFLLGVFLLAIA